MKKSVLILACIALTMTIQAQTIALHSASGAQLFKGITALTAAYTAAQDGDTLYLSGHTFTPPAAFNKQLMIFGAGHYVDSTLVTGKTFINGNVTLSENADKFYMEGIEVNGTLSFTNNHSVNNVVIKRCKINGLFQVQGDLSTPSLNLALLETVFINAVYLHNAQDAIISNCIVQLNIGWSQGNVISNNIILFPSAYSLHECNNNQVYNNVFLGSTISQGAGNNYNNNLFVGTSPSYGTTATVLNSYTGIAQNQIFTNQTGTAFNYGHNYHLQSPTTYPGRDGSQIGIFGGTFPYKEGAVPSNPHFQLKNIAPTTDANGNLQIQIQVEAQND